MAKKKHDTLIPNYLTIKIHKSLCAESWYPRVTTNCLILRLYKFYLHKSPLVFQEFEQVGDDFILFGQVCCNAINLEGQEQKQIENHNKTKLLMTREKVKHSS